MDRKREDVEATYLARAEENIETYRKGDGLISLRTAEGEPAAGAEVEVDQVGHAFHFGSIIFPLIWQPLSEQERALFKTRFLKLFNLAVFPFYWRRYEPQPGRPDWQEMVPTLAWCQANRVTTKGHPLVWTNEHGIPSWLSRFPKSHHEELLKARVINTVAAFEGEIDMWDVVNEFTHLSTWDYKEIEQKAHTPEEVADFVEKALHWAQTGNPDATLVLNNFDIIPNRDSFKEFDRPPRERLMLIIEELKRRDAPISSLGLQAHEPRDEWYSPETVWTALEEVSELGFPIQMTEFTPRSSGNHITGGWREGIWTQKMQADYTEQMLTLSFGHPNVTCFNFWGMPDAYAWLSKGGLVDEAYRPKPVYQRVDRLINETWRTRHVKLHTDAEGEAHFRGFYGTYNVAVRYKDSEVVHVVDLAPDADNTRGWDVLPVEA